MLCDLYADKEGDKAMSKTTQTDAVYKYMKTHKGISSMQAFSKLGITRLSARIWDLRHKGIDISTSQKTAKTQYGKTAYTVYSLKEKDA